MNDFPKTLLNGYGRFRAGRLETERKRYTALAEKGQSPRTMFIGCCDSRVAPETIFDAGPGEMFVVRNVANLIPPYAPDDAHHGTSAALEFAVQGLGVHHIVIMGHGRCGGIQAALAHDPAAPVAPGDFISRWMSLANPALAALPDGETVERQTAMERLSVQNSLRNLRSFPFVAERECAGSLALHGAWFDVSIGELWLLVPETGSWRPVTGDA